jgi:alpha/beta hydrolase family protein
MNAPVADLEGPITVGRLARPVSPRRVDLAAIGYVEEEWFAAGSASAFASDEAAYAGEARDRAEEVFT